ncbi:hypothetical protein E2493_13820 [Sphingomonas parva]|uniref:Tetratricopeptide repeat protein n=1 Tax=Sphingomonas parva TaxID=2555898 RepID=A0A4Y8ZS27_9SPHN|nr:hypothetical protein [Sphingomonas parva]TFI57599.1 hypothetical protein E2493_13820 [Sphingomonas parva]
MIRTRHATRTLLLSSVLIAASASPARAAPAAPERFELGINSTNDGCIATRQWTAGESGVRFAAAQPFSITCRGVSAAEAQGYVYAPDGDAGTDQCGASVEMQIAGLGPAEVRRCIDPVLARQVVDLRFTRDGKRYRGVAVETALAPLEAALRVIATGARAPSPRSAAPSSIALADLPPAPATAAVSERAGLTAEAALAEGIAALQTGRTLDASRILNDALRAFVAADAGTKLDLRLAAGLADSNLSQFDAADAHFVIGQLLLNNNPGLAQAAYKQQQLTTYRGLHLVNQRRWDEALEVLSMSGAGSKDLSDPATLSQLNQEPAGQIDSLQSSLTDANLLSRSLLDAQRAWALSVAQLGLGRTAEAEAALAVAADLARTAVRTVAPERIVWIRAAIERQKGRIEARKGAIETSLANFDCAITALQGGTPSAGHLCVFPDARPLPDTALNAPLLVEAQLERASVASRDAARDPGAVLKDYEEAVQSLANLSGTGPVSLGALERYFALLAEGAQTDQRDEEFFRAMQSIGEPAIAREYAQLQKVVSADPEIAGLLRERTDLERQLIRLRYEITASTGAGEADLPALERERAAADARLDEVNRKLLAANRIGALAISPRRSRASAKRSPPARSTSS